MKPESFFIFKSNGSEAIAPVCTFYFFIFISFLLWFAAAGVCDVCSPSPLLTREDARVMRKIKAEAPKNNKEQ